MRLSRKRRFTVLFDALQMTVSSFHSAGLRGSGASSMSVAHTLSLPPGGYIAGKLSQIIALKRNRMYTGMAVSQDGKVLIVAGGGYSGAVNIYVHTLPDGKHVRTFGRKFFGTNMFRNIDKLCLAPNGNILVAETWNKRVQEVTLKGAHVRNLGVGLIDDAVSAIACSDDTIAVAKGSCMTNYRVFVFSYSTGSLLARFGEYGSEPGNIGFVCGIRFVPDSALLCVVEGAPFGFGLNRLSFFTRDGGFVKCVRPASLRSACDVEFDGGGATASREVIVADRGNHRLSVFELRDEGRHQHSTNALHSQHSCFGEPQPTVAPGVQTPPAPAHSTTPFASALDKLQPASGNGVGMSAIEARTFTGTHAGVMAPVALALVGGSLYVLDQYASEVTVFT